MCLCMHSVYTNPAMLLVPPGGSAAAVPGEAKYLAQSSYSTKGATTSGGADSAMFFSAKWRFSVDETEGSQMQKELRESQILTVRNLGICLKNSGFWQSQIWTMFHRCGMMWVCCTVIIPKQIECQIRPSPCACFEAPEYLARMIQDRTCSQLTHYYKLLDTRHRSSIQVCHETRAHMRTDPHTHTHVYILQTKAVFGMFTYPFFWLLNIDP